MINIFFYKNCNFLQPEVLTRICHYNPQRIVPFSPAVENHIPEAGAQLYRELKIW